MSIHSIVSTTAAELAPADALLPRAARLTFFAFHQLHRSWRWIRLGNIYSDPHNFAKIAAGHSTNYFIGDKALVRLSAISVLISTRILHAAAAYEQSQQCWQRLKGALHNNYPKPVKSNWDQKCSPFSPSSVIWIHTTAQETWFKIQALAMTLFQVAKSFLLLSLRIADAAEAFTFNPVVREEGVNLMFVNSAVCLSKLIENKRFLLASLETNREIVQKVLTGLNSWLTVDELIDTVDAEIEKVETLQNRATTIAENVGEFISVCGQKWAYEFFHEVGLRHLAAAVLSSYQAPAWERAQLKSVEQRFPPKIGRITN